MLSGSILTFSDITISQECGGLGFIGSRVDFGWGLMSAIGQEPVGSARRSWRNASGTSLHTLRLSDDGESMSIHLADCGAQRSSANKLLNRMYSWRGYGSDHQLPQASNSVTFTAASDERVVGTLTLTVDSGNGLAADQTFADELKSFREAPGARLCELTKFAFDASGPSRPRLAALFHVIFIYGSAHYNCTDLLIEVNPRHQRFYEVMLGFRPIGSVKNNAKVGAPAQLMWLNVAEIRRQIDRHAADDANGRSLYPHFFSLEEEQDIRARLTHVRKNGAVRHANRVIPGKARAPGVRYAGVFAQAG